MTREEAIADIKNNIKPVVGGKSLDMAIEALSEDISEDGTLKVKVKDGSKVNRVLVWGDNMFGGLYYPDRSEGEWIEVEDYNGDVHYKCDQCGEEWTFLYGIPKENNANFCPNCGANMRGKEWELLKNL